MADHINRARRVREEICKKLLPEFNLKSNPFLWCGLIRYVDDETQRLPESTRWWLMNVVLNSFEDTSFSYFSREYVKNVLQSAKANKALEGNSKCHDSILEFLILESESKLHHINAARSYPEQSHQLIS